LIFLKKETYKFLDRLQQKISAQQQAQQRKSIFDARNP